MRLVYDVALGLWESIRETLPGDEQEAGVFLAGMTWGLVLFFSMLFVITWLYFKAAGLVLR